MWTSPRSAALLWLAVTCGLTTSHLQAQEKADTLIGCLTWGSRSGFYTLREEGTGFSIAVAGDLSKFAGGSKVKLTGKMEREQGFDVFRASDAEQLSATCEPTSPIHLSTGGMKKAVGRATVGIRGGIGFDPEVIYLGAHAQLGPIVKNLWFRASYEFGFGEVTKVNSFNLDFAYFLPLTARGNSTDRENFWNIYAGAGPAGHLIRRSFEEEDVNIDFGDWDFDVGLNLFIGLSKRNGFFTELRSGVYNSSPTVKLIVGYTFR